MGHAAATVGPGRHLRGPEARAAAAGRDPVGAGQHRPDHRHRAPPANGVGTGSGASSGDGVVQKVSLEASDVDVALDLEHRRKGLLWYSTYRVRFAGAYRVANHTDEPHDFVVSFMFPTEGAIYDNFRFAVGGREVDDLQMTSSTVMGKVHLAPGESQTVEAATVWPSPTSSP